MLLTLILLVQIILYKTIIKDNGLLQIHQLATAHYFTIYENHAIETCHIKALGMIKIRVHKLPR